MTKPRPFFEKLRDAQARKNSLLCVGLDPDHEKIVQWVNENAHHAWGQRFMSLFQKLGSSRDARAVVSAEGILCFCEMIVQNTARSASVFKLNAAFFSQSGLEDELQWLIPHIKRDHKTPVILDAKRGDIGNTAEKYAREAFERFGADAVTVNPYMGLDTIEPFLEHEGRGVIVLCRTSNPGGGDFQDLKTETGLKVYEQVAVRMAELNLRYGGDRIALVVGATRPAELKRVRELVGDAIPLLIPGIGTQGGDVKATAKAGRDSKGGGMMINSSRGIIYAKDPAKAANETKDLINLHLGGWNLLDKIVREKRTSANQ